MFDTIKRYAVLQQIRLRIVVADRDLTKILAGLERHGQKNTEVYMELRKRKIRLDLRKNKLKIKMGKLRGK